MNDPSDSDRMPLEVHPMTVGERRDAQVKVLENLTELLTLQMADVVIGQQRAAERDEALDARLDVMEERQASTAEIVAEVRDIMSAVKSGIKFLGWIGKIIGWIAWAVKWLGGIAAALAAIWAVWQAIKTGSPFPPSDK